MKRGLILCGLFSFLLVTSGCGSGFVPVTGTVSLDGAPVAGAQVTFVTENGEQAYVGGTNESGTFEITSGPHKGVPAGSYKVTVIKSPRTSMTAGMKAGDDDYMKDMMANMKKDTAKTGTRPTNMPGGKGMMVPTMPGGAPVSGGGATAIKSELPVVYSVSTTTPFKVTIPHDGPVKLELTADKKDAPKK